MKVTTCFLHWNPLSRKLLKRNATCAIMLIERRHTAHGRPGAAACFLTPHTGRIRKGTNGQATYTLTEAPRPAEAR